MIFIAVVSVIVPAIVTASVAHVVSVKVVEAPVPTSGIGGMVTVVRIVPIVHVSLEIAATTKPRLRSS
jgi:hypothetical protein